MERMRKGWRKEGAQKEEEHRGGKEEGKEGRRRWPYNLYLPQDSHTLTAAPVQGGFHISWELSRK